uniref:Tudor domain-containing protein n=1 Tax=Parastrongyloides trichosuri TaxID=131310 RepID=A0A0N4ZVA6_PARTI
MWDENETKFWNKTIGDKVYDKEYLKAVTNFVSSDLTDAMIEEINKILLRDNAKVYAELGSSSNTTDNLLAPTINHNQLFVGNKVLALYEDDEGEGLYVATIQSINFLKKTVNIIYEGFEEEGEYEVMIIDICEYKEDELIDEKNIESYDEIFDRNCIIDFNSVYPLNNVCNEKIFGEYSIDGMYYIGEIINYDKNKSIYEIIFSGFQEEGSFNIESSKVIKCPDECYNMATEITFGLPLRFPQVNNSKEELMDSYLLGKYNSEELHCILNEMIKKQEVEIEVDTLPFSLKKYFVGKYIISFDKLSAIYTYMIFASLCFLKTYNEMS